VFQGSLWNCSVRNLAITGDPEAKAGSGIVFKDGEWSGIAYIDYCRIMNFAESGIRFEGNPKAPFSSNTVSNCWLVGNLGDQLYSRNNNDFYISGNQFGSQPNRVPRTGALLDHSSAGTYTKNYHWGNYVALRIIGSNFNRIENNRLEQSRESGIVIGDPKANEWSQLNIILGNTIHTNSETNFGKFPAVVAYNAVDTTFCCNQIFSWDSNSTKMKSGLVLGSGCRNWIVKDNIIRHYVEEAIVYDKKAGHIVKDNILDSTK
ncbi:MAG: right-handed parallel beta-helix repeat-containing protein, partial [Armatimonadota bacterium]|nr:right-handed parallel beta-helix repeat-containing protein [Armatimonadota bacterium]